MESLTQRWLVVLIMIMMSVSGHCGYVKNTGHATTKQVKWLYMLKTDQARVENKNAKMILHVPLDSTVIAFGDRPARVVKKFSVKELADIWDKGSNSFQQDPPNAALMFNQKSGIFILKSMYLTKDKAVLEFEMDGDTINKLVNGDVGSLFMVIDRK